MLRLVLEEYRTMWKRNLRYAIINANIYVIECLYWIALSFENKQISDSQRVILFWESLIFAIIIWIGYLFPIENTKTVRILPLDEKARIKYKKTGYYFRCIVGISLVVSSNIILLITENLKNSIEIIVVGILFVLVSQMNSKKIGIFFIESKSDKTIQLYYLVGLVLSYLLFLFYFSGEINVWIMFWSSIIILGIAYMKLKGEYFKNLLTER